MHTLDTTSYWLDSATIPRFPQLERDIEVDAIVVGGGIMGVTAAYLLKQAGQRVALIERGRLASVDTGHTTAHLTAVTDMRLTEIAGKFSKPAARAVWDAGAAAIDQIVTLIRKNDIQCDFRWVPGYLQAPLNGAGKSDVHELEAEVAFANELSIAAEFTERVPFFNLPGIKFSHQALFHPIKYLAALARRIPANGSHVYENTEVEEFDENTTAVKCGRHHVKGKYIVIATHTPLTGKTSTPRALLFQTKLALYTSYAVGAQIPSGTIPEASYWDTSDPYYYLRVEKKDGYDYAIFGGEDHKTGQAADTPQIFRELEKRFRGYVPSAKVDYRWSGQVIETNDGLPFIGETADRQFAATGFSGNGMTFGTLAAMMSVDAMLKRKNPWQELFDPHRAKVLGGTWDYLKENADYPYYMVRDWIRGAETDSLKDVHRNEGKIVSMNGKKVAAYRDGEGQVSLCSPVCTHLQCIVGWNHAEQTWDCPCHGSRFKPTGEVIAGPAEEPLKKLPSE